MTYPTKSQSGLVVKTALGLSFSCFLSVSFFIYESIYLFLAVLHICCSMGFFSSCSEWRLLSSCDAWTSHCSVFSCWGAQALGTRVSVVMAPGF